MVDTIPNSLSQHHMTCIVTNKTSFDVGATDKKYSGQNLSIKRTLLKTSETHFPKLTFPLII